MRELSTNERKTLLTVKEVAARLDQGVSTVRRKIARGTIPAGRLGPSQAARRVDARELDSYYLYAEPRWHISPRHSSDGERQF